MTSKGDSGVRCYQITLILGNAMIACLGITLSAMCIFFLTDQSNIYTMVYEGGNDSIFRGTWIGLFTGLAYFCTSILGMYCIMKSKRILLLVYILLMVFIFCFETASCITAITHGDYFVPNMFLKQMLRRYNKPLPEAMPSSLDEIYMTSGITHSWNRFMTEKQCCGVYGPQDWVNYSSEFRLQNSDADFPWPRQCCQQDAQGQLTNLNACKIGVNPFLSTRGCFDFMGGPLQRQAWGVGWFGFAIQCWTFVVIIGAIYYYVKLD
ncbi:uroplakin-1b-like [Huso huso]|uniref:Uroplakin-1b-like n=1 Tax=Huso huso TaxID=61971 RepID=A0ABR0ZMF5_HUSHU